MSRVKKMFVPDGNNEQAGSGLVRSSIKTSMLEILVKLGKIDGYNADGNIRGSDNIFLDGTDIGALVTYAVTPEKLLRGKKEFIALLRSAGIPPLKIANENLRKHMPPMLTERIVQPAEEQSIVSPEPMDAVVTTTKRKQTESVGEGTLKRARTSPTELPPPPPLQLMVHPDPQQSSHQSVPKPVTPETPLQTDASLIPLPDDEPVEENTMMRTRVKKNKTSKSGQFNGLRGHRYEPY